MMDDIIQFRPGEHIVYREEDDGAFLFDPNTGNLKYMNRSARLIYGMLDGRHDINEVIRKLQEVYLEAGEEQIRKDVDILLAQLEENGFISAVAS